jgi:hypothetical protein
MNKYDMKQELPSDECVLCNVCAYTVLSEVHQITWYRCIYTTYNHEERGSTLLDERPSVSEAGFCCVASLNVKFMITIFRL